MSVVVHSDLAGEAVHDGESETPARLVRALSVLADRRRSFELTSPRPWRSRPSSTSCTGQVGHRESGGRPDGDSRRRRVSAGRQGVFVRPGGLELRWDERVICHTARGRDLGRVVQAKHQMPDEELTGPLKRVVRRATPQDEEQVRANRVEAKRAMLLFRELIRRHGMELKPVSSDVIFDGTGSCSPTRRSSGRTRRAAADRSVAAAEAPRRPPDGGAARGGAAVRRRRAVRPVKCCNRFPSHEPRSRCAWPRTRSSDEPGPDHRTVRRLRCCLAFEHPIYQSFRDRAPAVGAGWPPHMEMG